MDCFHAGDENRAEHQPSSTRIINLNVGGQPFATSRETLSAAGDSYFSSLIGNNFKVERDHQNNLFIDRDPKLFAIVLNFLRSQCTHLAVDKCNRAKLQALYAEAEFYAVAPLMEEVERQLSELDEEERKREAERSRQKIPRPTAPRPAMVPSPTKLSIRAARGFHLSVCEQGENFLATLAFDRPNVRCSYAVEV